VLETKLQFEGIVISIKANYFIVEIQNNNSNSSIIETINSLTCKRYLCTLRKRLVYNGLNVNVGDYVKLQSIDSKNNRAVINEVMKRKNLLLRPQVANVSDVFVVLSVEEPSLDYDQANRFLVTSEQTGANISLILSKIDLIEDNQLVEIQNKLRDWGYEIFPISVYKFLGIDSLINKLYCSKLSVLCGPSGVGKSSLLNNLIPDRSIPIATVSDKLKRGKHTTRNVELYSLDQGSLVADTPGFNRPSLDIKPLELGLLFPEIRFKILDSKCKFRNCLHRDEPGCCVDKSWGRYPLYREILDELINSHL